MGLGIYLRSHSLNATCFIQICIYFFIISLGESKGQYVASRVHTLLTGVYWQNSSNAICSYQVRCMHVHVMAPGQRLYG
jgi:hypothetical protein